MEYYEEGEDTFTLSLQIMNIKQRDYGTYVCVAHNIIGNDVDSMTLSRKSWW